MTESKEDREAREKFAYFRRRRQETREALRNEEGE
jgi:hypothetical protein